MNFAKLLRTPFLARLCMWQLETQPFASSYIQLAYIYEANYSTVGHGGWAKYQVLTNQNSRNSWCQIVRGTMLQNTSGCCFWKKMDAEDEILMMGYLLMRKRSNHQQRKKWSGKYFCSITRCHSLPLVINRFSTRLSFYKRPFFHSFIKLKVYRILFFHLFSMDWRQK